jgi:hypothetical protein
MGSDVERKVTMSVPAGLDREDSETIGFVTKSLGCEAIDVDELHQWCYALMQQHNVGDLPSYIFDLAEFAGPFAKIFKLIGFVPDWGGTTRDVAALYGIAVKRGREPMDWPVKPETALRALEERPELEALFRQTFPFISY